MPRIINLSNASECSLNNPYYKVTATIRERYQYEWIEQILINELSIFPVTGRTYTISFEDSPTLSDVFNLMGATEQINLTFTEDLLILDVNERFIQRYEGTFCQIYVERVEADGGEVIDPISVCTALGYFSDGANPTTGYRLTFEDVVGVLTFESVITNVKRSFTFAFMDDIGPAETFSTQRSRNFTLSFTEQLDLSASN